MHGEVFRSGHHVGSVDQWSGALKTLDGGDTDLRDEIRIFSVSFFGAAPARVARQVQHRRQAMLRAARADFRCGGGEDLADKLWVPGRGECDSHRVTGPSGSDMPVKAFIVKDNRDSQASILFHPSLDRVGELRHGPWTAPLARARYFSQAIFQDDGGILRKEGAFLVDEERLLLIQKLTIFPGTFHLSEFLLERHAREQIRDALLDGQLGIAIGWNLLGVREGARGVNRQSQKNHANGRRNSGDMQHAASKFQWVNLQFGSRMLPYRCR